MTSLQLTNKILKRLSEEVVFPVSLYTYETLKTILKEELHEARFKKAKKAK